MLISINDILNIYDSSQHWAGEPNLPDGLEDILPVGEHPLHMGMIKSELLDCIS